MLSSARFGTGRTEALRDDAEAGAVLAARLRLCVVPVGLARLLALHPGQRDLRRHRRVDGGDGDVSLQRLPEPSLLPRSLVVAGASHLLLWCGFPDPAPLVHRSRGVGPVAHARAVLGGALWLARPRRAVVDGGSLPALLSGLRDPVGRRFPHRKPGRLALLEDLRGEVAGLGACRLLRGHGLREPRALPGSVSVRGLRGRPLASGPAWGALGVEGDREGVWAFPGRGIALRALDLEELPATQPGHVQHAQYPVLWPRGPGTLCAGFHA